MRREQTVTTLTLEGRIKDKKVIKQDIPADVLLDKGKLIMIMQACT